uniref:Protein YIPF n=1 Tax=Biomphalaria glabrata TaxID=6526 RepID=A0A2C9JNQ8_BIOGL
MIKIKKLQMRVSRVSQVSLLLVNQVNESINDQVNQDQEIEDASQPSISSIIAVGQSSQWKAVDRNRIIDNSPEHIPHDQAIVDVPLEGEIEVPGISKTDDELSTLDEPVKETIVTTTNLNVFLNEYWDLWGPLVLCTFLAIMLQGTSNELDQMSQNDGGPQFAEVFVIYWLGASIVTLNIKLLGGNISFFQSICVLGYCVCPLAVALIACRIILAISTESTVLFVIRFLCVVLGFGWSTFASTAFLHESQPTGRKALAMYPLGLFYFVISWLVISHSTS